MGLYDSLYATLRCPATKLEERVEIQFKWADRGLQSFSLGDQLKIGPYGNLWIPESYLCEQCTEYEPIPIGETIAKKLTKAVSHLVFIHLNMGKFLEVLTEEEFTARYAQGQTIELPAGETLYISHFNYGQESGKEDSSLMQKLRGAARR